MKNRLFNYFIAKTAYSTVLPMLLLAFSVSAIQGQAPRGKTDAAQPEAVFTNANPITLPDSGTANPYPSIINVTGLTGTIPTTPGSIKVTFNGFSHTFPADLAIVLVGPTGQALLLQDGVTGGQDAVNITYSISDTGTALLPDSSAIAGNTTYRPTSYFTGDSFPAPGPGTNYGNPGPAGGNTATFASVFGGTNPNGEWKLFIVDFEAGDSGSISGGWTLEITTGGGGTPAVFDNRLDFFGNGTSDFITLSAPTGGNITWKGTRNDNPTPPTGARLFRIPFGFSSDQVTAFGDYTGDDIADISIWRPGAQGIYYILRSDNLQLLSIPWGTTNDRTNSEGDYDGDGRMDATVIRNDGGNRRWFVLRSGTNTFSTFVFGFADDVPLVGADYTGDGADDPAVVRVNGTTGEIVWIIGNTSGGQINQVSWGNFNTDFVIPAGDYDGDGRADYAVWRGFGSAPAANGEWIILRSGGGVINLRFGLAGSGETNPNRDIPLRSGDYDNDDKTDIAVYRPSNQTFYVLRSSNLQVIAVQAGDPGDIPLARFGTF